MATTTAKDLSTWEPLITLYRGHDHYMTRAAEVERETLRVYLKNMGMSLDDIETHENGGCWVCGQTNYNHYVIAGQFRDGESDPHRLIEVGHICAEQLGMTSVERSYERRAKHLEAHDRAYKIFEDLDLLGLYHLAADEKLHNTWANQTVSSIWHYAVRNFNLTDPQINLLRKIKVEYEQHLINPKQEPLRCAPPVKDERQWVNGIVTKLKAVDNPYDPYGGSTLKMTVRVETYDGYWLTRGTVPASIRSEVEEGDTVRFNAQLVEALWSNAKHLCQFKFPKHAEIVEKGTES